MKSGEQGKWKIKPKVKSWKEKTVGVSGQVGGEEGRGGACIYLCVWLRVYFALMTITLSTLAFVRINTHITHLSLCVYIYIYKKKKKYV